jgi:hypothetical protein
MPIKKSLSKNQELLDLMKAANEHHEGVLGAHSRTIDAAVKCGKALEAAKEIVGHGKWEKFVRKNFKSHRTAQRYMKVYRAVESGEVMKNNYETLFELEADIAEKKRPGDDKQSPRDEEEPASTETDMDPESLEEAARSKKHVDPLAAAFRAIGKALNSVEGEEKAEWGKDLHAEVDLYLGPFESEAKRGHKS